MQINKISTFSNQNLKFEGNLQIKAPTRIWSINSGRDIIPRAEDIMIETSKIESIAKRGSDIIATTQRHVYEILNQGYLFENFVKALRTASYSDLTIFDPGKHNTSRRVNLNDELKEVENW